MLDPALAGAAEQAAKVSPDYLVGHLASALAFMSASTGTECARAMPIQLASDPLATPGHSAPVRSMRSQLYFLGLVIPVLGGMFLSHLVGTKGQIVIEKGIRDRLGIKPGWVAMQRLVDDHVEVFFVPPPHDRSLKGVLAGQIRRTVAPGEEWDRAREAAWEEAAREKAARWEASE
jgi:AbrB family looped-hinge helix DNA binding protein